MAHLANLDKAFALAHKASEDAHQSGSARAIFRAIAYQVWLSLGENRPTSTVLNAQHLREYEDETERARRLPPR